MARRPNPKLVPTGILRKLDPALPGIDESLSELEDIELPRFQVGFPPQRLTMALLGDYWAGRSDPLPSAALVQLLVVCGITEAAARVTLGRLAARGLLTLERRGRTTWYRQSPTLLGVLLQGRAVIAGFGPPRPGWAHRWTLLHWTMPSGTADAGQRLRTTLREMGFVPLSPALWASPFPPPDALGDAVARAGASSTLYSATELGGVPTADAWDLDVLAGLYEEFLDAFGGAARRRELPDAEAFAVLTRASYRWFVLATLDPDLPAELLPPRWPRADAHATFEAITKAAAPGAVRFVRALLEQHSPELAALVTAPPGYRA